MSAEHNRDDRAQAELNNWQIVEIKKALSEADAADFATEKEIRQVIAKWTLNTR